MADEIRLGISVETEDAGTRKAQQELAKVRREIEDLKKSFRTGAIGSGEFSKRLTELDREAKKLDKSLDALGEKRRINIDTGNLEDASKASGAARLQTLGRDIRHLPSVRVPGLGVGTDTFGRAAEVAGRLGLNLEQVAVAGAATVIAVGLIAVAFKNFADEAKRQAQELTAVVDARRGVGQDIAKGLTTEDAEKRLEEINRLRAEEQKLLDDTSQALKDAQRDTSVVNLLGGDFETTQGSRFLSGLIPQVAALQAEVDESTASVAALEAEENALNTALEDGTLAANDAAQAEQRLAQERIAGILEEASQTGELAGLKQRAADLTQEEIDKELERLSIRETSLKAELASLEASGDTSEEVTKKIAQLREELGFLGEQAGVLNTARRSAKSSEAEKAREKAAKEAEKAENDRIRKAAQAAEKAARAQDQYNEKLDDTRQKFRDTIQDIGRELTDNFQDIDRQFNDDLAKQSREFNNQELTEERAFQRDLAQIRRDSERAELDATRSRDFAALRAERENRDAALQERITAEQAENAEQLTEFQQGRQERAIERDLENRDARIDADRARRDAAIARDRGLRDARETYNRALQDQQQFGNQFVGGFQRIYERIMQLQNMNGGGRTTNRTSRQSSTNNDAMGFDDMQAMLGR